MVKKTLLSLGLAAIAFTAQAQTPIFHEGFDADQTKAATELGWYEFINSQEGDTRVIVSEGQAAGAGCLQIFNSETSLCENQGWQRAIKFRNLPLESGKIYQINFKFKGSNRYNKNGETVDPADEANNPRCEMRVGLMQGYENTDISILDQNGADQTKSQSYFNPEAYESYSYNFYFADKANQDAQYKAQGKDEAYINNYFAALNIINPGTFYIDEVELVALPGAVDQITYGGDVIRVKYMFNTNIAALAGADALGRVILDRSCASVKVGGETTPVEAVELHKDGYLYIFLEEQYIESETSVEVSFTNPDDVINFSGTAGDAKVFAFEAVAANGYDEEVANVSSFAYEEAALVSSNPANNSFCLDETISEFTFTYDHDIYTGENDFSNAPKAVLSTGEALKIKEGQDEVSKSITFVRTGTEPLTKGAYKITVSGITTVKGTECTVDQVLSFETGAIKMASIEYTPYASVWMEGEYNTAQPTNGWIAYFNGDVNASNANRVGNFNTASKGVGFYFCQRDGSVPAKLTYGEKEDAVLTLPAGNVQISICLARWQGAGGAVNYALYKKGDMENAIASGTATGEANIGNFGETVTDITEVPVKLPNFEGGDCVLVLEQNSGWSGTIVFGFDIKTYEETPGDKFEPEVLLDGTFSGDLMPAEGSGWLFYENNNQLTPGSGRNGTSGILARNFHSKMQSAAFFRECGANDAAAYRIEYANGNGIEGGFEIAEGNYEITYYAGTWNDNAGNAAGSSKVFMQIIDAETGAIAFSSEHVNVANFENGGACNGQADKVVESFNAKAGKYYIKAWGTSNTVWGSLSIVKPGSKAAQYYSKMQDAVAEAKAELEKCADEKYNGTAKTELTNAIEVCSDPSGMHTVEEFEAAMADLKTKQEAMANRRAAMANYDDIIAKSATILANNAESKFNTLDEYKALNTLYTKYNSIPAQTLENDELLPATADMQKNYDVLTGLINDGIPALTEQIVKAAAQLVALDPTMSENESVIASANILTDDVELHNTLNLMVTKAIYDKLASGENIFEKLVEDEEMGNYTDDVTFDLSFYTQNPNVYIINAKHDACKISDYPGWTSDNPDFAMRPNYGWGGWTGSETHLINNNMFIGIGWVGDDGVNVWTNVSGLPVGKYDFSIETMDRSGAGDWVDGANTWPNPERQLSYIFYQQGENEKVTQAFDNTNIGQYYGFTEDIMPDVEFTGETVADVKVGAYLHAQESFAAIQKVKFVLKGKKEGFSYADAAKELAGEITTNIQKINAVPEGEPVNVQYYSLDGKKVATPAGATIKVATYKNGVMQVSKFIAK